MLPLWTILVLLPVLGGAERFNCRSRILGAYYADAKSGCKAFHVCVRVAGGGIRDFRFFCPPGTLFHQEAQTCTDWGDDDPLACPADIYDGFDTKKLSSPSHREEESEFGLQRAETGDRRLSQNNVASDLRAAHSSDFFSGQRDRGRDEPATQENAPIQHPRSSSSRQSFRRVVSTRAPPRAPTTQYTDPPSPPSPQPSNPPPQYDYNTKRKLLRKRPVYTTTLAPTTTYVQNTQPPQKFPDQQQNFNRKVVLQNTQTLPPVNVPPQFKEYKDEYVEVSRVTPKPNKYFQSNSPAAPFSQSSPAPNNYKKNGLVELYNLDSQSTPGLNTQADTRPFKVQNSFNVAEIPREPDFVRTRPSVNINNNNNNFARVKPTSVDYNKVLSYSSTTSTPAYKNFNSVSYEPEKNNFVSYSKQNYFNPTTTPSTTFYTTTTRSELPANLNTVAYNTNIGFNTPNANFAESDEDDGQYKPPQGEDDGQYRPELYERERELLSGAHSLNIAASGNRLPEDQKPRGKAQQPYKPVSQTAAPRPFRPAPTPTSPSTQRAPDRTYPTTTRPQAQQQTQRAFDYFQTYTTTSRPSDLPVDPFSYETRAPVRPTTTPASRIPEPKPQSRAPPAPQTRPPTPPSLQTRPPAPPAPQTRPPAPPAPQTRPPAPPASHTRPPASPAPQTRPPAPPTPQTRPPAPPAPPTLAPAHPRPSTRPPSFANPPNNKEDASYDYAYYDSDTGFSEYDHIEEFGRTKKKA
ncbi:unnamed protein product [Chilo suppressalis]|uniref:Chitin-binding type-2 domain-containing protein n=1 Tax=Chilo suppressalis TaxID=168631 RepID=A0ABN8LEY4_CHISP|nr:unnamed protein product [Chilo suppressalis]